MTFLGRDAIEVEALITDRYLESLLAGHAPASGAMAGDSASAARPAGRRGAPALDESVRFAIGALGRDLPRFHPSFRFEERLSLRLDELAATLRLPAAAGAEGVIVPLHGVDAVGDPFDGADEADRRMGRPIIIGGALTSAALSIAGVAWVAWRRSHPGSTPMARAIRAVNAARAMTAARTRFD